MDEDIKIYNPNPAPLPCPICGANAIKGYVRKIYPYRGEYKDKQAAFVFCENCRPRKESVHYTYSSDRNLSELSERTATKRAIASWNRLVKSIKERE